MVNYVVFWLNQIPKEGQNFSPRGMILGGQKIDYKNVCRLPFGAYVQVHDDRQITNTMESRTTGAINLGATGNVQGAHRFLSLVTGDIIVCRSWTELPIPAEVLIRMEELSTDPNDTMEDLEDEDEDVPPEVQIEVQVIEDIQGQSLIDIPEVILENVQEILDPEDKEVTEERYEDMPTLREISNEEIEHLTQEQNKSEREV